MNKSRHTFHPPAVVLGTDISALNIVRSLGRKGIATYVLGNRTDDYAAASKYAAFRFCEDLTDEKKVIEALLNVSRKLGERAVLFCTADLHVLYVSKNRDILDKHFAFVLPEHDVIEMLLEKRRFHDFAVQNQLPVPATFFSANRSELEKIIPNLPYPCAVKPLYRTAYWSRNVPPDKKVMKFFSPRDLWRQLAELNALNEPLIFQEWIEGGDEQVLFCLAYVGNDPAVTAYFTGRKLRQYPPLTGVTSLAESVRDVEIADLTFRLFTRAGFRGLCSLECKYDVVYQTLKITEPTVGRVDLQEGIAVEAGVDLPMIAYEDAIGRAGQYPADFTVGIKWVNEPFEFNAFLTRQRGNGGKGGSFFEPYRGERRYAVMAWDDPRPFFLFLKKAGGRGLRFAKKAFMGNIRQDA